MAALTTAQLEGFKNQLFQLKKELEALIVLSEHSSEAVQLDQSKVGRLSRMDALQQQAMAQANRSAHQQRLAQVGVALAAIKSGDYGYCEECGQDIQLKRLQARPESVYCITCQSKLEEQSP